MSNFMMNFREIPMLLVLENETKRENFEGKNVNFERKPFFGNIFRKMNS